MNRFPTIEIYVKDGDGEFAATVTTKARIDMAAVESFFKPIDKDCAFICMRSGDEYMATMSFDDFADMHDRFQSTQFMLNLSNG